MNRTSKIIVGALCALSIATSTYAADKAVKATNAPVVVETVKAPVPAEAWTLSLGGSGTSATKGASESAFGVDISIGRTGHLLLPIEFGVRQGIGYATPGDGKALFSTKVYNDWTLLTVKKFDIFAGGNIGLTYGNTPLNWTVAPEVGARYWLKKDVAVIGRVDYPFDINAGKSDDALNYFLGVQVKF